MRKMALLLTAALFTMSSVPAFAQTAAPQGKDECLLTSKDCINQVDDIYKRMHRLQKEIKKGKRVYNAEELKKLQQKLTETQELLDNLEKPGR